MRRLTAKIGEYKDLEGRLTRPADFDAAVATLRAQAGAALHAGRFDLADRLLAQAEDVDLNSARERVESETQHMQQASGEPLAAQQRRRIAQQLSYGCNALLDGRVLFARRGYPHALAHRHATSAAPVAGSRRARRYPCARTSRRHASKLPAVASAADGFERVGHHAASVWNAALPFERDPQRYRASPSGRSSLPFGCRRIDRPARTDALGAVAGRLCGGAAPDRRTHERSSGPR